MREDEIVARIYIIGAVHFHVDQLCLVPDPGNDHAHADGMLAFKHFCLLDARRGLLPDRIGQCSC
jgi:hypothetical protein